ncbi:MAG: D-alanyl-D-alanine carboxypeptidase/D-alanyl-D-alanine-endopeptidase [Rhodobacteraceae bacterium]|nr:D-alanyl-D-alanine carboxypeptidase/D-alanyl-D-alanine-endopeptidase [Paracoccaceae bacterium]
MRRGISKREFLAGLLSSVGTAGLAAPLETSLRPVVRVDGLQKRAAPGISEIVSAARLNGEAGIAVADAESGKVLESHNGKDAIAPASVTKALTALYALAALGPQHRFQTRVVITGTLSNGRLSGDVVLSGGGDPTLDTDALADLAKQLKQAGVQEVSGKFLVADGALPRVRTISEEQPDHLGYSPAVSGIALNHNRVHFEWKRSSGNYAVTMQARTGNFRPGVETSRMTVIDRSVPVYTYEQLAGSVDSWTVARSALGNGGARWLPVRNPGLYAGDVFRTLARSHGIVLPKAKLTKQTPSGQVVAAHSSAPLVEILRGMLEYSNNLTAEMVGMSASNAQRAQVNSLRASARKMNAWVSSTFDVSNVNVVDHSGLGSNSRMSAQAMVTILSASWAQAALLPILKDIGVRDAKGRVDKGHPTKVKAKTGTLNFVSNLAGYATTSDGKTLAFAMFVSDQKVRARIGKANREAPQGARAWTRRARSVHHKLINRWSLLHGS